MSITIKDLNKRFDTHEIFSGFNATFNPGEVVAITGASGCGKTTFLRILAGLDTDFEGQVDGVPNSLSYLFQESRLLPWLDVTQNIGFVVKDVLRQGEIAEKTTELLKFAKLTGHSHKKPTALSGGMQRRVALCRSFIYPANLLIMDEPFSGLDAEMKDNIATSFLSLVRKDQIVLLVTHDAQVISKCHRVLPL